MSPLPIDNDHLDDCLSEVFDHDVSDISESLKRIKPKMSIKVEAMKIALEAQNTFMEELKMRMSSTEDAIKNVRQRLLVSTNVKAELDTRIENDTKMIKDCMRHLTQLRKETRNINNEKDALVEKKKHLLESMTSLHADVHKQHAYMKTLNKQRSLADGRICFLNDTIAQQKNMEDELHEKIAGKDRSIQLLEQRLGEANASATDAEERTAVARQRMDAMCTQAAEMEHILVEIEEKARVAEEKARVAEEKARVAEDKAKAAEERARVAEDKAKAAEDKAKAAEDKAKAAEDKAKAAEENVESYERISADAEGRVSNAQKFVSSLQKKVAVAGKRAIALEKKVVQFDQYAFALSDRMTQVESRQLIVSKLDGIISSQDETIALREKQLKLNLHTIIHRDKDLIRAQNVITLLHHEILDIEKDISLAKEYAHKKRMSILNHTIKEIS